MIVFRYVTWPHYQVKIMNNWKILIENHYTLDLENSHSSTTLLNCLYFGEDVISRAFVPANFLASKNLTFRDLKKHT